MSNFKLFIVIIKEQENRYQPRRYADYKTHNQQDSVVKHRLPPAAWSRCPVEDSVQHSSQVGYSGIGAHLSISKL